MTLDAHLWEAACTECDWRVPAMNIRGADFRAELHATTTGHKTEVDQYE